MSPPVSMRSVALPREHGGWSLTLEPALLGLLVAPSLSGALLAVAALVAFLARTPAELFLVDRFRRRTRERTVLAARLAGAYGTILIVLLAAATVWAQGPFWMILAIAAPLLALELAYAQRSRSRRLVPELAGSIAIGAVAPAVAVASGEAWTVAWGLWLVVAARVIAAIPFVRVQLRRTKEQGFRLLSSDVAQATAVALLIAGMAWVEVPIAAGLAVTFIGAVHVIEVRRPPRRAAILGAQQVVLGLTVVLATGLGYLAP